MVSSNPTGCCNGCCSGLGTTLFITDGTDAATLSGSPFSWGTTARICGHDDTSIGVKCINGQWRLDLIVLGVPSSFPLSGMCNPLHLQGGTAGSCHVTVTE